MMTKVLLGLGRMAMYTEDFFDEADATNRGKGKGGTRGKVQFF